ncbi:MAG: hypothetical protein ACLQBD_02785 [Syntrophobacteraceae bacterium]
MSDESLLPGNLDLSSIPDAPRPQPLLTGLDQSSTPDAPQPDENPGHITQPDPLSNCIINLRKSILGSAPPEQPAGFMTESDPLSNCTINLRKSIFPTMPPEQQAGYMTDSDPLSSRILELKKSIFASAPPSPVTPASAVEPRAEIASTEISTRRDRDASPDPAEQKKKPEDSWFWQTLESSDTLKPYAERMREYVESPTDTKGAWDWLTSTIPKSGVQLRVGLTKTPFDLAQTFSGESKAAIEKFLQEHPEYEEIIREDPSGESLQALAGIGVAAGTLKTAEMAAKRAAAGIGKPLGIDTEKQTWTWETFKDAWVNHPVESFAAVFPLGASFLKRKGITPSEIQVKELVDSTVKDEKTPLAQELKNEMEQGPPKEELDFSENWRDPSKSGTSESTLQGAGA